MASGQTDKCLMMLATPAGMPGAPRINDLDLQTAANSVIESKKLFAKVTNCNPTRRVDVFLRAAHSHSLDLIPRYACGSLAFLWARRRSEIAIPQQREGHGAASLASVAKEILSRHDTYPPS
jgi:hypothetical protein